jgi:hypothetical protein
LELLFHEEISPAQRNILCWTDCKRTLPPPFNLPQFNMLSHLFQWQGEEHQS